MDASTKIQSDTGAPTGAPPYSRTVVMSRTFDAPRSLMWKMWTEAEHLAQWFGPQHFTNHNVKVDARVGGKLEVTMRSPQNTDHPAVCIFREVKAPERLVFSNDAYDTNGERLLEGHTTVTFEEIGGKTKVMLETTAKGVAEVTKFMLGGMKDGWDQSWDKLVAYLKKN